MDSRPRQRSIALNHIPPLRIPHGLEYPLGSRMHLSVVHLRLEARGRPLPRSPRSPSRVNPRVLRPLTRGPQFQPSPLRTPHSCPRVQGIFPTFRGQAPHGWPMVHHSMATGFPIPGGCCSVFSASPRPLVRNPAASHSYLPHPVPHSGIFPASRAFLFSWGCCAALATLPSWSRPLFPSPILCFHTTGPPAALWRGLTGSSSIQGPFHAPCSGCSLPTPFCLGGLFPSGPVGGPSSWARPPFPLYPCLFPTWSPAFFFFRAPPGAPLLHRLFLPAPPLPARSVLFALRWCIAVFFCLPPPPLSLCILHCGFLPSRRLLVFFHLPPCMHALHCTALVIGSRLPSVFVSGLFAVVGRAPWRSPAMAGGCPSLALLPSLPSLLSPPLPPPVPSPSPPLLLLLFCSGCCLLLFPSPGLYLARLSASTLSPPL